MKKKSAYIGILASTENPDTLEIFDGKTFTDTKDKDKNLVTEVNSGDYVNFVPFGDIIDIIGIDYEKDTEIFSKTPRRHKSGIWIGKVKTSKEKKSKHKEKKPEESYSIYYIVKGHQTIYKQDPKIRVDY